ncbi:MAG: M13 family metallopeptidase [Flavobacteriales bacterium]|nr:M13 family metallopeptidase [Flavobacteriales bacterium]
MKQHLLIVSVISVLLVVSCGGNKHKQNSAEIKNQAIDLSMLDSSINPADDFFDYVNSKWIKANPIPASKSAWGAFYELDEKSLAVLKEIQEKAAADQSAKEGSNTRYIGDFYRSAMDSVGIDKAGLEPLLQFLTELDTLSHPAAVAKLYGEYTRLGITSPIAFYVEQDFKNTTRYISYIYQSGLGLPDRDYYFRTDESSKKYRDEYLKYMQRIFELAGYDTKQAEAKAKSVFGLETVLAKASMTLVEQRDPYKTYNLMKIEELRKSTPNFNWDEYFRDLGIVPPSEIVIGQPDFLKAWNVLLKSTKMDVWRDYFRFHVINSYAEQLSANFEKAHFEFYDKVLNGKQEMEPRWKKVTDLAGYLLRDILGQEYVKVAFDENAKKEALELVENLRSALSERIDKLTWMGDSTKMKAKEKLNKMIVKIGYPDKWRTYEGLQVKAQHYALNVMAGIEYEFKRNLSKLGKEIDRTEWGMGPQTVNAYYNPLLNEIVFPAAILQPPFFDPKADKAVNYGGIGMVIGHELTHGFDDQGRQFDANGNLSNWWTADDEKRFKELATRFVKQYSAYVPVKDIHINGELTLGENIADLGGMIIAYTAFKKATSGKKDDPIDGLTPDQRFFINFAQIWRTHYREEAAIQRLYTDPHSPPKYRVIGTLTNMPEFYTAFNVKEGNKMYTPDSLRCMMW